MGAKCFYHSSDLDGKCSAAIVRKYVPDVELCPINYGQVFPWDTIASNDNVYMVDFALQPFSDMIRLNQLCRLIWIDHHKSALEEQQLYDTPFVGVQRIGIGACALVWEYLFPNEPMPEGVRLLAEYDVWNHENPKTLLYQYGMRNEPTNPEAAIWSSVFSRKNEDVDRIEENGVMILNWENRQNEIKAKALCFPIELDGLQCIAANIGLTNSKLFDSVWDPEKYDAMLTFNWRGGQWTVSLYTTEDKDIDVGTIAKARGGGGHKGAAGFQCKELPFKLQ